MMINVTVYNAPGSLRRHHLLETIIFRLIMFIFLNSSQKYGFFLKIQMGGEI